jgi:hypothetical protein
MDAHDGLADRESGAFTREFHDPAVFVAQGAGHGNLGMPATPRLEVGAASGGRLNADDNLSRGRDGDREVFYPQDARCVQNNGFDTQSLLSRR